MNYEKQKQWAGRDEQFSAVSSLFSFLRKAFVSLNNLCDPFRTERNTWLFVLLSVIVCLASKLFAKAVFDYSGGRGADADAVYVDKEILRSGDFSTVS